jgi:hypothetical protein
MRNSMQDSLELGLNSGSQSPSPILLDSSRLRGKQSLRNSINLGFIKCQWIKDNSIISSKRKTKPLSKSKINDFNL